MYKRFSLILIVSIAASAAMADTESANYRNTASAEETTGFIGGMVLGGLAGGPPGVVLGAAIGAVLGDGFFAKKQVGDLQANLYRSQLELASVQEQAQALQREYRLALQELDRVRIQVIPASLNIPSVAACCDNTVLSLHFRTGSSTIESHYEEQLTSLVNLANQMPSASVEITGFADRNGDASHNLALSRERTRSVKQFFNRMGIQNSSITTVAYGETQPLQATQNIETDFFDRRVIVRLRDTSQRLLTQTPEGE